MICSTPWPGKPRRSWHRTEMHMTRRLTLIFITCLASLSALAQGSDPRWYQVEIVVFLNETAGKVSREDWSRDPGMPDLQEAVTLQPIPEAAAGLMPFQILTADELELGSAVEKLRRSGHYKPLLHTGWRQPVEENQVVFPPVLIDAPLAVPPEKNIAEGAVEVQPADTPLAPALADPAIAQPIPLAPITASIELQPPEPKAGIEGFIRLRVARFLHLDVDLVYRKELPLLPEMMQTPNAAGSGALLASDSTSRETPQQPFVSGLMADFLGLTKTFFQPYRLTEQRRMRRDELHYIDHPYFGVLAKVSAYELPAAENVPAIPVAQPAPLPLPVTNPGKATAKPLR